MFIYASSYTIYELYSLTENVFKNILTKSYFSKKAKRMFTEAVLFFNWFLRWLCC